MTEEYITFLRERGALPKKEEGKEDPEMTYPDCSTYNKMYPAKDQINDKELHKQYTRLGSSNIKTGNVFTVEPGIYFIDTLIESAKQNEKIKDFIDFEKVEEYKVSSK